MSADDFPPRPEWHWLPWKQGDAAEPLARAWLARRLGCAPDALQLVRDAHGRPRITAPASADASWSHSGDGLLVALGRGVRVGIDLERLRPRPRALALAERYFAPAETRWLAAQPGDDARSEAFLRLWCAKEAVLKAHGRGLAFGLQRLAFAERDGALALVEADPRLGAPADWRLHEFEPRAGYRAALAWTAAVPGAVP